MDTKVVSISLPVGLVKKIDEAAKDNFETRSSFIRMSLVMRFREQSLIDVSGLTIAERRRLLF